MDGRMKGTVEQIRTDTGVVHILEPPMMRCLVRVMSVSVLIFHLNICVWSSLCH